MHSDSPNPMRRFHLIESADLPARPVTGWVWHGYLPRGRTVLLSGLWKCGKTTLVSLLLRRMAGGGTVAGHAVAPGRAVVVSDENEGLWAGRHRRLGFGPNVRFLCQPFDGAPTQADWQAIVDNLMMLRGPQGLDLVVIDSLVSFLPGSESDARVIQEFFHELRRLTALGTCVFILHHPRTAKSARGQTARGHRILTRSADVVLELEWAGPPESDDRRRRLWAFSPFAETPPRKMIELSIDHRDYACRGDFAPDDFRGPTSVLLVLERATRELNIDEILSAWPSNARRPHRGTLARWLARAVDASRIQRTGTGRKNHPYLYSMPRGSVPLTSAV